MPELKPHQKYGGITKKEVIFTTEFYTGHVILLNPLQWDESFQITLEEFKKDRIDRAHKIGSIIQKLYPPHTFMATTWNSYSIIARYCKKLKSETLLDTLIINYPELEREVCDVKFYNKQPWPLIKQDILRSLRSFCALYEESIESDSECYPAHKAQSKILQKKRTRNYVSSSKVRSMPMPMPIRMPVPMRMSIPLPKPVPIMVYPGTNSTYAQTIETIAPPPPPPQAPPISSSFSPITTTSTPILSNLLEFSKPIKSGNTEKVKQTYPKKIKKFYRKKDYQKLAPLSDQIKKLSQIFDANCKQKVATSSNTNTRNQIGDSDSDDDIIDVETIDSGYIGEVLKKKTGEWYEDKNINLKEESEKTKRKILSNATSLKESAKKADLKRKTKKSGVKILSNDTNPQQMEVITIDEKNNSEEDAEEKSINEENNHQKS